MGQSLSDNFRCFLSDFVSGTLTPPWTRVTYSDSVGSRYGPDSMVLCLGVCSVWETEAD